MKSTIRSRSPSSRGQPTPPQGPLSVTLPLPLRERLAAQARKRNLKLATAARVLLDERVSELEDEAQLTKTEEWQRAQAWATWERIKLGDVREVQLEEIREDTRRAVRRARTRRRR